jgi:hypothetical protein
MVHRINSKYFERKDPVKILKILILGLLALCIDGVAFSAGTGGSGGSPPAIYLPKHQFTEMTLGILRGDDILIRSDGLDKTFHPTNIDSRNGTILVSSPEDGETIVLQDFDKKFGRKAGVLDLMKKTTPVLSPLVTIPENPDVTTVPTELPTENDISE